MNDLSRTAGGARPEEVDACSPGPPLPDYITSTYSWAYINPAGVHLLDRPLVASLILWGNQGKLMGEALKEFSAGQKVLQAAHVYGNFTLELARTLGPKGELDVIDITPIQADRCRRKLAGLAQAKVRLADVANPGGVYDAASCYFLLHETPDGYKRLIVNSLLGGIRQGGKVVFIDYHDPRGYHPLKWFMYFIFKTLEPYAFGILRTEISDFADDQAAFTWSKQTYFGGLYQKVVAERRF